MLNGFESTEELELLGNDLFLYFGLGCRNVSKIYVPEEYNFNTFFEAIEVWKTRLDMHKYMHNYDYQLSLHLINRVHHLTNGFVILSENTSMHSPISVIYIEYYKTKDLLIDLLITKQNELQCLVTNEKTFPFAQAFGSTQHPELTDYADGIDTMKFLGNL